MFEMILYLRIFPFLKTGKIEQAIDLTTKLLNKNPRIYKKLYKLANKYVLCYDEAAMQMNIKVLDYLYQNSKGEIYGNVVYSLGEYYYRTFRYEKADSYFRDEHFAKSPKPLSFRIDMAIKQNDFECAETLIEKGVELWDKNPDSVLGKARIYGMLGEYHNVKKTYQDYARNAPDLSASHFLLGQYYKYYEGNLQKGKSCLAKALELFDNDKNKNRYAYFLSTENIQFDIKNEYFQLLRRRNELNEIKEIVKTPEFEKFKSYWDLVNFWKECNWQESHRLLIGSCQNAETKLEQRSFIQLRGETCLLARDYGCAREFFLESIQIGDSVWWPNLDDYVNLNVIDLLESGSMTNVYLEKVNKNDLGLFYKTLVSKLEYLEEYEEALRICLQCEEEIRDKLFIMEHLAECNLRLGNLEKAKEKFHEVLDFLPTSVRANGKLLLIYQEETNSLEVEKRRDILQELGVDLNTIHRIEVGDFQ